MLSKKVLFSLFFALLAAVALSFADKGVLGSIEPATIFFAAGKHYFSNNDYSNAVLFFKKAAGLKPDFAEAHHNLGVSYYYNGKNDEAIRSLRQAVEAKNDYGKAHYSIGLLYHKAADFDNAVVHLLRAVQLDPGNSNAHFDLAIAYVDRFRKKELEGAITSDSMEDLKAAVNNFLKSEELNPGFAYALSNAGIVESILNDYEAIDP